MQPPLFAEYDLVANLEIERRKAREKIESLNADLVLSQPLEILIDELVQEFADEELVFLFEEWSITPPEDVRVDVSRDWAYGAATSVSGTRVQVRVPFRGNENLLRMRASTFSSVSPRGQILGGIMVGHTVEGAGLEASHVEAGAERFRRDLTQHAEWVNADIRRSNEMLRQQVTEGLHRRREKLLATGV